MAAGVVSRDELGKSESGCGYGHEQVTLAGVLHGLLGEFDSPNRSDLSAILPTEAVSNPDHRCPFPGKASSALPNFVQLFLSSVKPRFWDAPSSSGTFGSYVSCRTQETRRPVKLEHLKLLADIPCLLNIRHPLLFPARGRLALRLAVYQVPIVNFYITISWDGGVNVSNVSPTVLCVGVALPPPLYSDCNWMIGNLRGAPGPPTRV